MSPNAKKTTGLPSISKKNNPTQFVLHPMIYPSNFEEKTGFKEIRQLLSEKCLSTLGKEQVEALRFSTQLAEIEESLSRVSEFMHILQSEEEFPSHYFFDVRDSLKRIRVEGLYMDVGELFDLRRSLETIDSIVRFLNRPAEDKEAPLYPHLQQLTEGVSDSATIIHKINGLIDLFGKIKDNASAELLRIRRELTRTTQSISQKLSSILRNAQQEGVVEKDVAPAMRDGRLVIPVAPGLKRKIRGIVHDESASGKTVFIEPAEVVEANNRIRELEGEERREIIRILSEFSTFLRPSVEAILESYGFLALIDLIRAEALFSLRIQALQPVLEDRPLLDWKQAVHPLLQLTLERNHKEVVPLDIVLEPEKRLLVISGPNAGGKSVCLKTAGLLQYMLQCGLPIPVNENSRAGIFQSLFIDIGDEQSIEDELSTYSSHLTNMKHMLRGCDDHSLILIDEFGGGTEPQIGGAIAEAMLKRFNQRGVFGIITTHYQNLKHFADAHEGIVNGAMLYDRHLMQPLFQLRIGNPGSSFAVEIARKIGLPGEVIEDAVEIVGRDYVNADKYLQDIVRDKRYWEQKRQQIRLREKQLEDTVERYRQEMETLQKQRREIMAQAKLDAELLLHESNAKIENTIRTIKEAQAEKEQTRLARRELAEFREQIDDQLTREIDETIRRKMEKLRRKQDRKKEKKTEAGSSSGSGGSGVPDGKGKMKDAASRGGSGPMATLTPGNYVRIKGQTSVGELLELNGKNAIVAFGLIKTQVKAERLEPAAAPRSSGLKKSTFLSSRTQDEMYEKKLSFKQDIDVRGMRGEEAIQAITYFVDDAIQIGMARVRILHGTGTGILRTLIREYLATVPGVAHFADEHVQLGGAGITVVDLA